MLIIANHQDDDFDHRTCILGNPDDHIALSSCFGSLTYFFSWTSCLPWPSFCLQLQKLREFEHVSLDDVVLLGILAFVSFRAGK